LNPPFIEHDFDHTTLLEYFLKINFVKGKGRKGKITRETVVVTKGNVIIEKKAEAQSLTLSELTAMRTLMQYFFGLVFATILFGPLALADAQQALRLERGKYLVKASQCTQCHTVRKDNNDLLLDTSKLLAGGKEFELPFGTVYSPNITPDRETGIGTWTEREIARAIREGIGKDRGKLVLMPWQEFRGMAVSDAEAIALYLLKEASPIKNLVPPSQLKISRDAIYAAALKHAAPFGPAAPPSSNALVQGEYLVKHGFACLGCHGYNLTGGTGQMPGPNLTSDKKTGLGNWTLDQIVAAIKEGKRPDGSQLSPVMPYATAFTNMTDSDARVIVIYLKSLKPAAKATTH